MKGEITFENNKEKIRFKTAFTCECPECGLNTEYSVKHDSYYCPDCNIWAESKCEDPECRYCKDRPEKPL